MVRSCRPAGTGPREVKGIFGGSSPGAEVRWNRLGTPAAAGHASAQTLTGPLAVWWRLCTCTSTHAREPAGTARLLSPSSSNWMCVSGNEASGSRWYQTGRRRSLDGWPVSSLMSGLCQCHTRSSAVRGFRAPRYPSIAIGGRGCCFACRATRAATPSRLRVGGRFRRFLARRPRCG